MEIDQWQDILALRQQKKKIRYWRLQENNLRTVKKGNCKLRHLAPLWPEIEEEIQTWFCR